VARSGGNAAHRARVQRELAHLLSTPGRDGIRNWKLALVPLSLWMLASLLAWIGFKLDDTGAKIFPYVTRLALAAIKRAGGGGLFAAWVGRYASGRPQLRRRESRNHAGSGRAAEGRDVRVPHHGELVPDAAAHALTRSSGAESVDPGLPARK